MIYTILYLLLGLYFVSFIYNFIKTTCSRREICKLADQSSQLIAILDKNKLKRNLRCDERGFWYLKNTSEFQNDSPTIKFNEEYVKWSDKAQKYQNLTLDRYLESHINNLYEFKNAKSVYLSNHTILSIISDTLKTPSILLEYIGIPENWFTKLCNVAIGFTAFYKACETVYKVCETMIIPLLKCKGIL